MTYKDLWQFYRSREWETLRKQITLERVNENGDLVCEHCGKLIIHPYDAICHHVIELTEENVHDANVSLNPENIMLVCHKSHNAIHDRWLGGTPVKKIYIVHGSPCAGKSAFVQENAGKQDLIIDIDRLYDAMSTGEYRGAVKTNVLNTYRSLIDMVRTRNGRWRTAWIVRTLPLNIDRERIVKEVGGGELIHIDTSHDECIIEARKRGGDWLQWVSEYWERFQE